MKRNVAIVGAGVSGLTCGVVFAEHGYRAAIFAKEMGQQTTSSVAAAVWFPYHVEPAEKVIPLALETYEVLLDLARFPESGVSIIESRQFSRSGEIEIPDWAIPLGASVIPSEVEGSLEIIQKRFLTSRPADGHHALSRLPHRALSQGWRRNLCERPLRKARRRRCKIRLVINCAGIGARELVHDADLEPHRGQVAIVPRIEGLTCAIVCDDAPLMYAIPRANDCVFGGTNEVSDNLAADPETTLRIVAECSRVLNIDKPRVLAERVGLRPFRRSGVRLERDRLADGRAVIHNYGHGGAGFTLSWGCAHEVLQTAAL